MGAKKQGSNKEKCKAYKTEGRREINKKAKQVRHNKAVEKKEAHLERRKELGKV
jgi:hypothetical protein